MAASAATCALAVWQGDAAANPGRTLGAQAPQGERRETAGHGPWVVQARYLMGTIWTIEARGRQVERAIGEAFEEVRRLERLLSTYRLDSEISRVNREAAKGWVPVSVETRSLLLRAFGYSVRSGGAFDPTVGPLVRLWGFKYLNYRIPDEPEIASAGASVGYRNVQVDPERGIRFERPGVELDLGGIAKGHAVDRALACLRARGAVAARVDAGGNQGVFGKGPAAGKWLFGIKHPLLEGEILGVVPLEEGAVSTSGDAERGFWKDGVRYGHILDPKTGKPAHGTLAVTVVAPTAEQADALSTTLYVLGAERGKRLLTGFPGCEALFVEPGPGPGQWRLASTPGFRWKPW